MKYLLVIGIVSAVAVYETAGHGRSAEMIVQLNAPVPEWMFLARPVAIMLPEDGSLPASGGFRPGSGGAAFSTRTFSLPGSDVEWEVEYEISRKNGVSLSPDGRRVIVNSGTNTHLYEVRPDGSLQWAELMVPHVTYDEGLKGFIGGWIWAGNDRLLGHALINDEQGHMTLEKRLYIYYLTENALARVDLSALPSPNEVESIDILGIELNSGFIRMQVGEHEYTAKADLTSPPLPLYQARADAGVNGKIEIGLSLRHEDPETSVGKLEKIVRAAENTIPLWVFVLVLLAIITKAMILLLQNR